MRKGLFKHYVNVNYFKNIDSEDKAYFLGLLLADGCISNYAIKLRLQENDKYIIDTFKKCIESNHSLYYISPKKVILNNKVIKSSGQWNFSINRVEIIEDLIKLGIFKNKTYKEYSIPKIEESLIRHFLRGYFDGDGCVSLLKDNRLRSQFIGCKTIIKEIEEIFKKLNIIYTKEIKQYSIIIYVLKINRTLDNQKLYRYLYHDSNFYLYRKKDIFEKFYIKNEENKCKYKNILCITDNIVFDKIAEAAEYYKVSRGIINENIRNIKFTSKTFLGIKNFTLYDKFLQFPKLDFIKNHEDFYNKILIYNLKNNNFETVYKVFN